jgi:hypothetical protein
VIAYPPLPALYGARHFYRYPRYYFPAFVPYGFGYRYGYRYGYGYGYGYEFRGYAAYGRRWR